jgi:hypothetical protein
MVKNYSFKREVLSKKKTTFKYLSICGGVVPRHTDRNCRCASPLFKMV